MPISIVICAKNELHNLKIHLPFWLTQNYPTFEIIIVNDNSTDESKKWLNEQANIQKQLKIIHIDKIDRILKGKRHALWQGIQAAEYEYLLFTDADCKPSSPLWVQTMADGFSTTKEIVIGYSPYKIKNGLLNQLIQYDTYLTAIQYLGFAEIGMPYMAVGRNVAYKKSAFTKSIFLKSNKSTSGDDDLVFQQIATDKNVSIVLQKESFVESNTPNTYKDWIRQKQRHLGAGKFYPLKLKFILGLFSITFLLFHLLLVIFTIQGDFTETSIIYIFTISLKTLIERELYSMLAIKYLQKHTIYLGFLYSFHYLIVSFLSMFASNEWK